MSDFYAFFLYNNLRKSHTSSSLNKSHFLLLFLLFFKFCFEYTTSNVPFSYCVHTSRLCIHLKWKILLILCCALMLCALSIKIVQQKHNTHIQRKKHTMLDTNTYKFAVYTHHKWFQMVRCVHAARSIAF